MKKSISLVLSLVIVLGVMFGGVVFAKAEENSFYGKTIAVLGDSISTYSNYSNGAAASGTNSTIAGGAVYYPRTGFDVTVDSTWWMQVADSLGMNVLVNNSWSGSCLLNTRSGTVGAYVDRCVQLHDNTGENAGQSPDIIAIFLGTNDYYTYPSTLGSFDSIDFDSLIVEANNTVTYSVPKTSMEAYAIVLHKIKQAYPDAEIYCFTLLQRVNSASQPTEFNADIVRLAEKYGAYIVDLYNCGIESETIVFNKFMGDNLHPNSAGMDAISNAFISSLLKNSEYNSGATTHDVNFVLSDVVTMEGVTRTVSTGERFTATLCGTVDSCNIDVSVQMGGKDITKECYKNGVVTIPSVTDEVVIRASKAERSPTNFFWEINADGNAFVSVIDDNHTENNLTMVSGNITDGKLSGVKYTLESAVVLKHDKPWSIEWRSEGTWSDTTDGALLFAGAPNSSTVDTPYLYRRHNSDFIAFGVASGGRYYNYGVSLKANGIDGTVAHVYKLENRIENDGSNMVYLFVDGKEIGPMNHHWIGGTDQKTTDNWVSGRDFVFTHMGTNPHTIGNCYIDYIQVCEDGHAHMYKDNICIGCGDVLPVVDMNNYFWEINADGNALVSVTNENHTENNLTMVSGSITDGKFSKVKYTLQNEIILKHNKPWIIEWKSEGTWSDTTDGALLFAGAPNSSTVDTPYLYRRHNSDFIAFGVASGGRYYNYGVSLKANGIDGTVAHVYKLENRIENDGSNMVYLFIDGVEIGPMNHHWIGGTDQKTTDNWVSGRDFVFTHMGTNPHTIGNCYIDYIQVCEDGHAHMYKDGVCVGCGDVMQIPDDKKTIAFCIGERMFTATEGQSWAEWILSYGISAGDNGIVWIGYDNHPNMEYGYLYYGDDGISLGDAQIKLDGDFVRYDDIIQSATYTLYGPL